MGFKELRQHVRFQPSASAQLRLEGGLTVPCSIRDISMGGAYLVRRGEPSRPVCLQPGDRVRIRVQDPTTGERCTLSADIVRIEQGGGPGLAVRFILTEETVGPVTGYVQSTGLLAGAPEEALKLPRLRPSREPRWAPVKRIGRLLLPICVSGLLIGVGAVGFTWLESVLI
jgi:hypothetical protein